MNHLARLLFLLPGVICSAANAGGDPFTIIVDESVSSVTVQLCIPGGCGSDVSSVAGFATISVDDPFSAGLLTLHDFDLALTDTINIGVDIFLGSLDVTGTGLALFYAQPGMPLGPTPIVSDAFDFVGVPTNAEGLIDYQAEGTACLALQASGLPCADSVDLAQQGTQLAEFSGTLVIDNRIATMTINPDVEVPLDPNNPDLGTLSVVGTVVGSVEIPDLPAPPPLAGCPWGLGCDDCPGEASCIGDRCYVPRNRYLCIDGTNASAATAIRVDLLGEFPEDPAEFMGWIGPADVEGFSTLQDSPHYVTWPTDVKINNCAIAPGFEYEIKAIAQGDDIADESAYSNALILPTALTWGDVAGPTVDGVVMPPDGFANFVDVLTSVQGFQGLDNAPMDWLDVEPQSANQIVNFADILLTVQGFQSEAYPFDDPWTCLGF
jgi:hypothetical protein